MVTDEQREQLFLAPDADTYQAPEWITRLAAERRAVCERVDERKAVRVPIADPDYEPIGEAWTAWAERGRGAILQRPKPALHNRGCS